MVKSDVWSQIQIPASAFLIFYLFLSHFSPCLEFQPWQKVAYGHGFESQYQHFLFFTYFKENFHHGSNSNRGKKFRLLIFLKIHNALSSFTFALDVLRQTSSSAFKLLSFSKYYSYTKQNLKTSFFHKRNSKTFIPLTSFNTPSSLLQIKPDMKIMDST